MTAAAYWIARSRLRQGFAEAFRCWHAEALAEAASQAMTAGEYLTAIATPQALNFLS
jgi:hypothetical protein